MIIGICGTHGTGKSTVLQAAKKAGFNVDETQLSRTAQKVLGWDRLSRAEESIDSMWALQDAVLQLMYVRDKAILEKGVLTVVERTPADVWAYTALWCSKHGIDVHSRFIQDKRAAVYRGMCRDQASRYAKFVVVPPCDEIAFQVDPHRADLASRNFVEREINSFLWDGNLPISIMKTTSREMRAAEIQSIIAICDAEVKSKNYLRKNANE